MEKESNNNHHNPATKPAASLPNILPTNTTVTTTHVNANPIPSSSSTNPLTTFTPTPAAAPIPTSNNTAPASNNNNNNNNTTGRHIRQDSITDDSIAEMSENHRYIRFPEIIRVSFNSLLTSYKAFDTTDGVEIVWHKISLPQINQESKTKFIQFMNDLSQIINEDKAKDCHHYFVENVSYWFSNLSSPPSELITVPPTPPLTTTSSSSSVLPLSLPNESSSSFDYLNIITTNYETIREFISKVKTLRWKIIKKWCRQLVKALIKLHEQPPIPIIHRHISCSHIYIDGGLGTIAVGDIWLSFQSDAFNLASAVNDGTRPNFDDPKGDVYAFGLCVLEMVSKDTSSKKKSPQPVVAYTKEYIASILPRINNEAAKEFIQLCLAPLEERPDLIDLQNHPFLVSSPADDEEVKLVPLPPKSSSEASLVSLDFPSRERLESYEDIGSTKITVSTPDGSQRNQSNPGVSMISNLAQTIDHNNNNKVDGIGYRTARTFSSTVRVVSISKAIASSKEYQLQISIPAELFQDQTTTSDKEVEFSVDFEKDDAKLVATEMIEELGLTVSMEELAGEIEKTVKNYDDSILIEDHNTTAQSQKIVPQQPVVPSIFPVIPVAAPENIVQAIDAISPPQPSLLPVSPCSQQRKNAGNLTQEPINPTDFTKSLSEDDSQLAAISNNNPVNTINNSIPLIIEQQVTIEVVTSNNQMVTTVSSSIPSPSKSMSNNNISNNNNNTVQAPNPSSALFPTVPLLHTNSRTEEEKDKGKEKDKIGEETPNARARSFSNTSVDESNHGKRDLPIDQSLSSASNSLIRPNLSAIDITADILLQKILEKIDQEARAARRAFEARIQKLINIQEKCEEDLTKLKTDLNNKVIEFDKKEENTKSKRDIELLRLKQEFESKVRELRTRLKSESLLQQQQQLQQSSLQGQTIPSINSEDHSNNNNSNNLHHHLHPARNE